MTGPFLLVHFGRLPRMVREKIANLLYLGSNPGAVFENSGYGIVAVQQISNLPTGVQSSLPALLDKEHKFFASLTSE